MPVFRHCYMLSRHLESRFGHLFGLGGLQNYNFTLGPIQVLLLPQLELEIFNVKFKNEKVPFCVRFIFDKTYIKSLLSL